MGTLPGHRLEAYGSWQPCIDHRRRGRLDSTDVRWRISPWRIAWAPHDRRGTRPTWARARLDSNPISRRGLVSRPLFRARLRGCPRRGCGWVEIRWRRCASVPAWPIRPRSASIGPQSTGPSGIGVGRGRVEEDAGWAQREKPATGSVAACWGARAAMRGPDGEQLVDGGATATRARQRPRRAAAAIGLTPGEP
jgi:hypothetical protein